MITASPGVVEESRTTVAALGLATLMTKPFSADELAGMLADRLVAGGNR